VSGVHHRRAEQLPGQPAAVRRRGDRGRRVDETRGAEIRRQAIDRMVKNARLMQADAVVMMRFDSSEIGQTMSEIVAYGTAAVVEPVP